MQILFYFFYNSGIFFSDTDASATKSKRFRIAGAKKEFLTV